MARTSEAFPSWESIAARIHALDHMLWERANALATSAGVGTARNVWSNAVIARESGHPWPEVDYAALRNALRVDARREALWRLRHKLWARYERIHYPERGPYRDHPVW